MQKKNIHTECLRGAVFLGENYHFLKRRLLLSSCLDLNTELFKNCLCRGKKKGIAATPSAAALT